MGFKNAIYFSILLLNSCSGEFKHSLQFSPNEPLRVAVLPFRQIDEKGNLIEEKGEIILDNIPVIYSENKDSPTALVRELVQSELKRTSLDVISQSIIDLDLPHRNLAFPDGRFNLERIFSVPAKTYCDDFLDCDAILFGTIKRWSRDYYGVQTNNEIEIELKLISKGSEKILFEANGRDSDSRGLTKGPTGYSSVILEPLKGLDNELIENLARRTVSEMLKPLTKKPNNTTSKLPPPAIYGASHDSLSGLLTDKDHLTVVAFGSVENIATFSIGSYLKNLPMEEISPGHYFGEYWPVKGESFSDQAVTVRLTDKEGRETKLDLNSPSLRIQK